MVGRAEHPAGASTTQGWRIYGPAVQGSTGRSPGSPWRRSAPGARRRDRPRHPRHRGAPAGRGRCGGLQHLPRGCGGRCRPRHHVPVLRQPRDAPGRAAGAGDAGGGAAGARGAGAPAAGPARGAAGRRPRGPGRPFRVARGPGLPDRGHLAGAGAGRGRGRAGAPADGRHPRAPGARPEPPATAGRLAEPLRGRQRRALRAVQVAHRPTAQFSRGDLVAALARAAPRDPGSTAPARP